MAEREPQLDADREIKGFREKIANWKKHVNWDNLSPPEKAIQLALAFPVFFSPSNKSETPRVLVQERSETQETRDPVINWVRRRRAAARSVATTSGGGLKGLEGATIGGALALTVAGGAVYLNKKGEKWKGMGKNYLKGVPGQFKGLTKGGFISTAN